jgi:hypothetical protein
MFYRCGKPDQSPRRLGNIDVRSRATLTAYRAYLQQPSNRSRGVSPRISCVLTGNPTVNILRMERSVIRVCPLGVVLQLNPSGIPTLARSSVLG